MTIDKALHDVSRAVMKYEYIKPFEFLESYVTENESVKKMLKDKPVTVEKHDGLFNYEFRDLTKEEYEKLKSFLK